MKAIIRWSAGLLSLLLLTSVSLAQGRVWISPVFKTPLPTAPSPSNSAGYYVVDAYGRVTGPHYYLMPPCQPFNGHLPGPIGEAIMAGNLPHKLLMCKEAMTIGDAPLLGQKKQETAQQQPHGHGPGGPPMMAGGPMPYPMANQRPNPALQSPYGYLPTTPYAMQPPYYAPAMPYQPPVAYAPGSPYAAPRAPYAAPLSPFGQPIGYVPYYGPPGMIATAQRDPRTGIWQVQNVMPGQGAPFMPIPGFMPGAPNAMPTQNGPPMMPMQPMAPVPPRMDMGQGNGFPMFGPMAQFDPFNPLQGPQPPRMDMPSMQFPRMDMAGPPPMPRPAGGYPSHPFTRSPRDFFMWGENMDDERARNSRPFPVP